MRAVLLVMVTPVNDLSDVPSDLSDVPIDLRAALNDNQKANDAFEGFEADHRDEIVQWVKGATEPEHRAQRVQLAIKLILEAPS